MDGRDSPAPTDDSKSLVKKDVSKYLELKELIKVKQKEVKELRDLLKITESSIVSFMNNHDLPVLKFKDGESLCLEQKKSKSGLKKQLLDEKFNAALSVSETDETKDILQELRTQLDNREVSVKMMLKHSTN